MLPKDNKLNVSAAYTMWRALAKDRTIFYLDQRVTACEAMADNMYKLYHPPRRGQYGTQSVVIGTVLLKLY